MNQFYHFIKWVFPAFYICLVSQVARSQTACTYRPNQDNPSWIDPSHWVCLSGAALCDADIPKYPVANDDVTSTGYNILVSGTSRTVNNITMTAGNFFPAKLTVQNGATFTCNNMSINSHATSIRKPRLLFMTTIQSFR